MDLSTDRSECLIFVLQVFSHIQINFFGELLKELTLLRLKSGVVVDRVRVFAVACGDSLVELVLMHIETYVLKISEI
jgi:hypothetical protein